MKAVFKCPHCGKFVELDAVIKVDAKKFMENE